MTHAPRPLAFDQPVPRSLVHRRSTNEVLPTDIAPAGVDAYDVALQWPRRHPLFRSTPLNSSLVAESIRQVTILVSHLGYGVSHDARFLMTGLGFELVGSPTRSRGEAIEVTCEASAGDIRVVGDDVRSLRIDQRFTVSGDLVAIGHGDARIVDAAAYARLRGPRIAAVPPRRQGRPIAAEAAGVDDEQDVVLTMTGEGPAIDVDPTHPVFFDHPLDHVPGSALIEACRQAARLELDAPGVELRTFEGRFHRIVEFGSHPFVRIDRSGADLRFEVVQDDDRALTAVAATAEPAVVAASR